MARYERAGYQGDFQEVCLPQYRGLRTFVRRATCGAPQGRRLHRALAVLAAGRGCYPEGWRVRLPLRSGMTSAAACAIIRLAGR